MARSVASRLNSCLIGRALMPRSTRPTLPSVLGPRFALGVLSALVAWLVVLSHLATTLHFALISHEICADHGELVHASAERTTSAPSHARGAVALPGSAHEAHDHCPVLGRRHEQLAVLASPAAVVAPAVAVEAPQQRQGVALKPSRAALLLAAPKQSPPV